MKDTGNAVDISKSKIVDDALEQTEEGENIVIVLTGKLTKRGKDGAISIQLTDAELEEPGEEEAEAEEPDEKKPKGVDYVLAKQSGN